MLRRHALNECVSRAYSAAAIPVKKELSGPAHKDGKRPNGSTLIPWRGGKPLAWDVTVCTTVADSYLIPLQVTQQEPLPTEAREVL